MENVRYVQEDFGRAFSQLHSQAGSVDGYTAEAKYTPLQPKMPSQESGYNRIVQSL